MPGNPRAALRDTIERRLTREELAHVAWVVACAVVWGLTVEDVFAVLVSIEGRFAEVKAELERRETRRRKVVPLRRGR